MITIVFDKPKTIVIEVARTKEVDSITVEALIDNPINKTVKAYLAEGASLELWSGDGYDSIGQWTDSDVEKRLKEIFDL